MQTSLESDSQWKRPEEKNLAKIHLSTLLIFLMQLFSQIRYACAIVIAISSQPTKDGRCPANGSSVCKIQSAYCPLWTWNVS